MMLFDLTEIYWMLGTGAVFAIFVLFPGIIAALKEKTMTTLVYYIIYCGLTFLAVAGQVYLVFYFIKLYQGVFAFMTWPSILMAVAVLLNVSLFGIYVFIQGFRSSKA